MKVTDGTPSIRRIWVQLTGIIAFVLIFITRIYDHGDDSILFSFLLFISVAVFNYLCLFAGFMKSFLSNDGISTIGGMCYSIYLIHAMTISIVGQKF
jgi:peptidoglycan/LPS O-acetylase OafA/YrhL